MELETVRYEHDEETLVATIVIDRPDRHNAFTMQTADELAHLWRAIREDDAVRAVILTASGDQAFCTGIDRAEIPASGDDYEFTPFTYEDPGTKLGPKANECWKPVIAAVNGMACGGAFYLLGEVDFIIAADHATFFDPHVTYGMPAVFEPILMLARMPVTEVLRMSLLGNHERLSATRAHEIGLVSEVVPSAELMDAARWAAEAIASQPPTAIQSTLRTIWAAQELTRQQGIELGNTFLNLGMSQQAMADSHEGFRGRGRIEPRTR